MMGELFYVRLRIIKSLNGILQSIKWEYLLLKSKNWGCNKTSIFNIVGLKWFKLFGNYLVIYIKIFNNNYIFGFNNFMFYKLIFRKF